MKDIMNSLKDTVNIGRVGTYIYGIAGLVGSTIVSAFGGWNDGMTTLVMFMCIDYITGLIVAGLFHASKKSETGGLESRAGWKGLCRKGMTMLIVLIAARIDITFALGDFTKNAVCIGFISMETVSIIENAGLMGMPMPAAVTGMIDLLTKKAAEVASKGDKTE